MSMHRSPRAAALDAHWPVRPDAGATGARGVLASSSGGKLLPEDDDAFLNPVRRTGSDLLEHPTC
jgi:hypothetical protein